MSVYVIAQLKMIDRAAYDRYQARFFDVFRRFRGRLLSADESPLLLEGTWDRDKLVLMSFPDEAAYRAWAHSPEYEEISKGPQSRRAEHRAVGQGICNAGSLTKTNCYQPHGPKPKPRKNGTGVS